VLFTKKYKKITKNARFFCRKSVPNLPLSANPKPNNQSPIIDYHLNPKPTASLRNIFTEKACFILPKSLQLAVLYYLNFGNDPDRNYKNKVFYSKTNKIGVHQ